jgi:glyoxylase-like metal-dependent hydrolase (beta-lactamase superfamily II)
MKEVAPGVFQLKGFPPNGINVYLAEDVVIDSASRHGSARILSQVAAHYPKALALTHGHADHQGSASAVCGALQIPLWCPEGEADAVESGDVLSLTPNTQMATLSASSFAGPGHPVARRLKEGDEVAGFKVLDAPGHSPGHIAYWRESDRTLILGDVLCNMNLLTGITGLHEPPRVFTVDPARNRESGRRLAQLEPLCVCFGHGPPLRDTKKLIDFVEALPR